MINYLKQYTDKTFEELVNSLIWFDNPLKLKAIFAKLPIAEPTTLQDLQSVIDVGGYAELGDPNSSIEFASSIDDITDREINLKIGTEIEVNDLQIDYIRAGLNSSNYELGNYASIRAQNQNVFLNVRAGAYETVITPLIPLIDTTLNFPAQTVIGDYTIDVTSDTLYTVGTLPSGVLNDKAIVTDATAPTYLGVLVGGGSVVTPVWHNGTIWVSR